MDTLRSNDQTPRKRKIGRAASLVIATLSLGAACADEETNPPPGAGGASGSGSAGESGAGAGSGGGGSGGADAGSGGAGAGGMCDDVEPAAPPCEDGWFKWTDTWCEKDGTCGEAGDGMCYERCDDGECPDPCRPKCIELGLLNRGDCCVCDSVFVCIADHWKTECG